MFDDYAFEPDKNVLFDKKNNRTIELKPLHTKLLLFFCNNTDQAFSIEHLKKFVWQQVYLSDSAVKKAISELRSSLSTIGDKAYVETIPHKGYRFSSENITHTKLKKIHAKHFAILAIITVTLLIIKLHIFSYLSPSKEFHITVINQSQISSFYNTQFRKDLLSALSKHPKINFLDTEKSSYSTKLSYAVNEKGNINISYFESNKLQWQSNFTLDKNYKATIEKIFSELSIVLALPSPLSLENDFESTEAFELFIKGKVTYYHEGIDSAKATEYFRQSLALQPINNPSDAALIDIYGLEVRRVPLSKRTQALEERLLAQVNKIKQPEFQSSDSAVALAKYYLVNTGDRIKALQALEESTFALDSAQDLHIVALTYALNDRQQEAEYFITLAQRRAPRHNAVLWYRVLVSLIDGKTKAVIEQADWAQSISPN